MPAATRTLDSIPNVCGECTYFRKTGLIDRFKGRCEFYDTERYSNWSCVARASMHDAGPQGGEESPQRLGPTTPTHGEGSLGSTERSWTRGVVGAVLLALAALFFAMGLLTYERPLLRETWEVNGQWYSREASLANGLFDREIARLGELAEHSDNVATSFSYFNVVQHLLAEEEEQKSKLRRYLALGVISLACCIYVCASWISGITTKRGAKGRLDARKSSPANPGPGEPAVGTAGHEPVLAACPALGSTSSEGETKRTEPPQIPFPVPLGKKVDEVLGCLRRSPKCIRCSEVYPSHNYFTLFAIAGGITAICNSCVGQLTQSERECLGPPIMRWVARAI